MKVRGQLVEGERDLTLFLVLLVLCLIAPLGGSYFKGFTLIHSLFDFRQYLTRHLLIHLEKSMTAVEVNASHVMTFYSGLTAYQAEQCSLIQVLFFSKAYKEAFLWT